VASILQNMATLGSDLLAPARTDGWPSHQMAPVADEGCYHCGQPMAAESPWRTTLDETPASFCCAGCQALAETIHAGGFGHLYRSSTRFATPLEGEALDRAQRRWEAYDTPELMAQFTRAVSEEIVECTLSVEGLRCAACVWLIEQTLEKLPGVQSAQVNFSTGRAMVRWRHVNGLSYLLRAMAELGYPAWPYEAARSDAEARRARRSLLMRLGVAMLGMMQVMMYAWPAYTHEASIDPSHLTLLRWASLLLTLPVVLYSAQPIFAGAWRDLVRHRRLGMDVPVALGIGAAFLASLRATILDQGEVWYDSVTMFVAFLLAARYLELRARQAAQSGAEALARQLPATVERLDERGDSSIVPVARLRLGDRLLIRPGETIPADGTICDGSTDVDESLLSGESVPVSRTVGATVLAGSFNCTSPIEMQITQVGANTRLAGIVQLLDRALSERPPAAQLADRVAALFVVVLLGLAALSGLVWWWIDATRALPIMVTVLVVSCPCALSLATPAALAAAQGTLARAGLLVTRGRTVESLAHVTDVVLDKTGTLTKGRFEVARIQLFAEASENECLALIAAMEHASEHPLARALCDEAERRGVARAPGQHAQAVPGQGMKMLTPGGEVRLGTRRFVMPTASLSADIQSEIGADAGQTCVWLADARQVLARVYLQDTLRDDAQELLQQLRSGGYHVHLVSGDAPATVAWWARKLGISDATGGVTPSGKREYVEALQTQGRRVLTVGDGINDAPVLAQADVSIAIGSGAPLAQVGADAVLQGNRLAVIGSALQFARRVRRVIRQNLTWAFAYNVTAIPLAMIGWMPPWLAAIGMSLSSLLVVGNAWLLSRDRRFT
jgi:Cu2+-exporting ATPase